MVHLRVLGVFAALVIAGSYLESADPTAANAKKSESGKADKKEKAEPKEKGKKETEEPKEKGKKDKDEPKEKGKKDKDEPKEKGKKDKDEPKEKGKKDKDEPKEKGKKDKDEPKEKSRPVEPKEKGKEKGTKDNKVPPKDKGEEQAKSDAELREALPVLQAVRAILERADHDYGGHRVDAVRDVGKAHNSLERALDMNGPKDSSARSPNARPEPQPISNMQLAKAIPVLKKTISVLNKANHDYHGQRADAVRDLTQAVRQLEEALKFEKANPPGKK